jgi:carboxyl-terminal processing protease
LHLAERDAYTTCMSRRNLLILLLAIVVSYACYVRGDQNPYVRYVAEGMAAIDANSLDPIPDRELFNGAMDGMVGVLDKHGDEHSEFLPQDEADPLRSEIRQQFGGIGVRIGFEGEPKRLTIVAPPDPGSPAAQANLLPGDHILSIDGKDTHGMPMTDVLHLIRGPRGTKVGLLVQSVAASESRTVELVREIINIESILGDRRDKNGRWQFQLQTDPRIAHVRIAAFGERTAAELVAVLERVIAGGAKAVVLDLRDDAGGALEAAVDVCKLLLPAGRDIVETRGRDPQQGYQYATTEDGTYTKLPIAVLVNQHSASAAEIVAACLQDNHRAKVFGQRSYGKGTVQQLLPLESGNSLLKLTWASFWRPSGDRIHRAADAKDDEKWGILPDKGFERVLSDAQYADYQKYRADRDLFRVTTGNADDARDTQAETPIFIDLQLQDAVNFLEALLDGQHSKT